MGPGGGGGPNDTAGQLQAVQELLRRRREEAPGGNHNGDSGRGGEAGDEEHSSSTASGEADMPTLDTPGAPPRPYGRLTPRQYLVRERAAEQRSEFFDGEIVAMAGASPRHAAIAQNIGSHLYFRLPGGCRVYQSDVKVQVGTGGEYAYPDVFVLCGEPRYLDRTHDVVTNPAVVFEVLSPGTEVRDRTVKAAAYRQVPSLAAYVLVSQKEPRVEMYARGPEGAWDCTIYQRLGDLVRLDAIGCDLSLAEIYRNVNPAPEA